MTSPNNAHSNSNSLSPLAFARAYQVYRQRAAAETFDDTRILLAARFWTENEIAFDNPSLATFWQEDLPPLFAKIPSIDFDDLHPTELEEIASFVALVGALSAPLRDTEDHKQIEGDRRGVLHTPAQPQPVSHPIRSLAARKWLYLGDTKRALRCLEQLQLGPVPREDDCDGDGTIGPDVIDRLAEQVENDNPPLAEWLKRFASDWHDTLDSGYPNRARCLLVEQNANGAAPRGRMTDIEARVEPIDDGDTDEIVIDHQVRKPDDPHIGSFAAALAALRLWSAGAASLSNGQRLSGRYTISRGRGQLVSGGSMGLAAFAVSYGAWRNRDLHRDRHIIGRSVALTGAIEPDGTVSDISPETLQHKIERVCHSPVTHVAIPEKNRNDAETILTDLHTQYPNRRLHLIPITTTADLLDDRNIIRPERLCLGEFAVKQVGRWGRRPLVLSPLLLLLVYLVGSLLYRPIWIWYDTNPAGLFVQPGGIVAVNVSGDEIGHYSNFPYSLRVFNHPEGQPVIGGVRLSSIADIDHDGQNEILFCASAAVEKRLEGEGPIYLFKVSRFKGLVPLISVPLFVPTDYPGDSPEADKVPHPVNLKFLRLVPAAAESHS